jgi:hypothetical protein
LTDQRFILLILIVPLAGSQGFRHRNAHLTVTMPHGSYSLGQAAAKLNMIRVKCPRCGRAGQYRIHRVIEQYGPRGAARTISRIAGFLLPCAAYLLLVSHRSFTADEVVAFAAVR